ncbi:MAG: VacJ family lipoprotein [Burkholderiales bacterium]|nr:VacJ family lipoprotein [Burkholderiales bacterium]
MREYSSTATKNRATRLALMGALSGFVLLSGCATGPNANPRDPLEPFNRGVYKFNDAVDRAVLKPVATAYVKVTPSVVRTGVNNFFGNLGDAWSAVNSVLQLHGQDAAESIMRFSFNTVFGLGGLLDIAGEAGLPRHKEDFGLTLARWGMPTGPYLVLPLLGPSDLRDTAALPVDWQGGLIRHVTPTTDRNELYLLQTVSTRANLLGASSLLEQAALDQYSFTRDVYLQYRSKQAGTESGAGTDQSPTPQNQNVPVFKWNLPNWNLPGFLNFSH